MKRQAHRCVRLALSMALALLLGLLAACADTDRAAQVPAPAAVGSTTKPAQPAATAAALVTTPATLSQRAPTVTTLPTATAAPTATLAPTADPFIVWRTALRSSAAADLAAHADVPHYDLSLSIVPDQRMLTGTMQLDYRNRTGETLSEIVLRLYPNFPRDVLGGGGDVRMDVTRVLVDGQQRDVQYAAEDTAVVVPLAPVLAPDASAIISVDFNATIRPAPDGTWPLPSYYPLLAVREHGRWRMDTTRFADHVYAATANYTARITAPPNFSIIASGSTEATTVGADGRSTFHVRAPLAREFALTAGQFISEQVQAGVDQDVIVHVVQSRTSGLDTAQIAGVAAAALTNFDQRFGRYPYRELEIHAMPGAFDGGDEYPGLILLYSDGQVDAGTRYVTAHEVAHQWWYGVVGNDIYRQPWLDEAFAQYSAIIYAEDSEGPAAASAAWTQQIAQRYRAAVADGDLPVGWGIEAYPNFNVYYRTVYGKGAVFLKELRVQVGDEAFFSGLQRYYDQHRYGIATTEDVQRALEHVSGQDLSVLFQTWVGSAGH